MKRTNDYSILAVDTKKVALEQEDWLREREAKEKIYQAFSMYITCMERRMSHTNDDTVKIELQQRIKRVKKVQKKYYVPGILEQALSPVSDAKKSSFSLIKKIKARF